MWASYFDISEKKRAEEEIRRQFVELETALAEIERGRGTLFDAAVVDACVRLVLDKGYTIAA